MQADLTRKPRGTISNQFLIEVFINIIGSHNRKLSFKYFIFLPCFIELNDRENILMIKISNLMYVLKDCLETSRRFLKR